MLKFDEFFDILEGVAPLELSALSVKDGGYDNSGVIVKNSEKVNSALFTLDLSDLSVQKAKELDCDVIVTHHPAIYYPIKNLSIDGENSALLTAIKSGISVISMHLNLDIADGGIDQQLAMGIGGRVDKIIELVDGCHGYGRECVITLDFGELVDKVKNLLQTDKVVAYGGGKCKKTASFCGGGASYALRAVTKGLTDADVIITSDLAHHEIKEIVESGKKLIIIPHYASEQYGFEKFYQCVSDKTKGNLQTHYFQDKRFM